MSKKRNSSFDPDAIVTTITSAIVEDLGRSFQEAAVPRSITSFRQSTWSESLLTKYDPQCQNVDLLTEQAFEKFQGWFSRVGAVNSWLENHFPPKLTRSSIENCADPELVRVIALARGYIRIILGSFDTEQFLMACRHAGGTTIGVPFVDTSISRKFDYPMSGTESAIKLFEKSYLPWDNRLKSAFASRDSLRLPGERYEIVSGSRATTVPKKADTRRMIAVEPTLNMFFQQGLMAYMYKRLALFGYDLSALPERHRRLAWKASIDGSLATIDFSSASDTVSLELVRLLFPANWFNYMNKVRSPAMSIAGDTVTLPMYATMGNATTFPVETLVFLSIGLATHQIHTLERLSESKAFSIPIEEEILYTKDIISVFGDDCIVPTEISANFCSYLSHLGFTVNTEKSFLGGPGFRESCGGDYLHGYDVRPIFLKGPAYVGRSALEPWLYTILNSVLPKYITYFGQRDYVYESQFLAVMSQLFRVNNLKIKIVPPEFPDDSGLRSEDWERLLANYDLPVENIYRSHHGSIKFRYMRFIYREKISSVDEILLCNWLKLNAKAKSLNVLQLLAQKAELSSHNFPKRKKGSYVVARGITSFWTP